MFRSAHTSFRNASPLAALAIATALLVASCGREPVGAGAGARATLEFKAVFQQVGNQTSGPGDDVALVRINIYKVDPAAAAGSSSRRTLIKTVSFDPDNAPNVVEDETSITFKVEFPLQGEGAIYEVEGQALNAAGVVYYSVAPIRFTARDINAQGGVTVTATAEFVGPGANAAKVVASPRSASLSPGQQFQFSATAFDANNAPIPGALLEWESLDNSIVNVVGDATGLVIAQNKRGSAKVVVRVWDTDRRADTVIVNVSLGASGIQLVSVGSQSAPAGSQLANPIVVKVVASDGVPIPGVTVSFSVGSGSVTPASATTASDGTAQTRWTLGSNVGQQTLNVSATGLPTLQVTATATSGTRTVSFVSLAPSAIAPSGTSTITVMVVDGNSQPVSGEAVTFSSSGTGDSFNPSSATTASNGQASTLFTASSTSGTRTITARLSGGAQATTVLTVAVVNTSATQLVIVSGNNQTVQIGQDFGLPLVVEARTSSGSPAAGAFVDFGSAAGDVRKVADSAGLASHTYYLPSTWPIGTFTIPVKLYPLSSVQVVFTYTSVP